MVESERCWRVPLVQPVVKALGAAVLAVVALLSAGDTVGVAFAGIAAVGLLAFAARDVLAPVRLAADAEGVVAVSGFASRTRVRWAEIEAIRVDDRRRFGLTSRLLEIDTGDRLYVFSSYDLGVPAQDAAGELRRMRLSARG
ncbi:MAG TPA: PH domain-containing protein [Streptosporangiaceae bacterium]|nr:PH domain-containing protein [Streptosporangiaceae bacterium]